MNRQRTTASLALVMLAASSVLTLTGCDRTVSSNKTTTTKTTPTQEGTKQTTETTEKTVETTPKR